MHKIDNEGLYRFRGYNKMAEIENDANFVVVYNRD